MITFEEHTQGVHAVAFSPDGARVVSGGDFGNKTLLWDTATGQLLRTFEGHTELVRSVAFSPDGTRVLSGSSDSTIKLWDTATGAPIRTYKGHTQWVNSVAFSPDGARVFSGGEDGIRIWNLQSGQLLAGYSADKMPNGSR